MIDPSKIEPGLYEVTHPKRGVARAEVLASRIVEINGGVYDSPGYVVRQGWTFTARYVRVVGELAARIEELQSDLAECRTLLYYSDGGLDRAEYDRRVGVQLAKCSREELVQRESVTFGSSEKGT